MTPRRSQRIKHKDSPKYKVEDIVDCEDFVIYKTPRTIPKKPTNKKRSQPKTPTNQTPARKNLKNDILTPLSIKTENITRDIEEKINNVTSLLLKEEPTIIKEEDLEKSFNIKKENILDKSKVKQKGSIKKPVLKTSPKNLSNNLKKNRTKSLPLNSLEPIDLNRSLSDNVTDIIIKINKIENETSSEFDKSIENSTPEYIPSDNEKKLAYVESSEDEDFKQKRSEIKAKQKRLEKKTKKRSETKIKRKKIRKFKKHKSIKLTPQQKQQRERNLIISNHPELEAVWNSVDLISHLSTNETQQPQGLQLQLLPFQKEGLNWLVEQEKSLFKGGVLADEMGMGKTIQIISLLLKSERKPNLIVAPTVALIQWMNEIKNHAPSLSTCLYYGKERLKNLDFESKDVVLTSYNLIESMYRKERFGHKKNGEMKKQKSIIHSINWSRVILDEAHYIKDKTCSTSISIFKLNSDVRWSVSGTPLQNRIGELFSTIRFLKLDPFSFYYCKDCECKSDSWNFPGNSKCIDCGHMPMRHFSFWNKEILKPIQSFGGFGEGKVSFEKLNKLLDLIMLRRTKLERADDLGLPPKVVITRFDMFNEEEEDFYESLYNSTKRKFNTYVSEGTVLNNYGNIFELISKMRLAANHPDLILKRMIKDTKTDTSFVVDKTNENVLICVVCHEQAEDPIMSKCKHVFCREDADQYLSSAQGIPKCPHCFVPLTIDLTQPSIVENIETTNNNQNSNPRTSIVNRINLNQWRSSTKIEALVQELDELRSKDNTIKSIVFSQFVNFLDLIQWRLNRAGFACCRLDGRMSAIHRAEVIKTFMTNHTFTVFLVSLKAGGIALNLTEASTVFMMDPWWNPSVEDQAMDRIHRLGQHRPIRIIRLIIENSIESRIIQLQQKKKVLFDSTIGKDETAINRLTQEDLQFLFL